MASPFVQVAVNVPSVAGVFDYSIPEALTGQVGVGHLVVTPFGKQTVQGVVLRFISQPSVPLSEVKDIVSSIDSEPVLTPVQIALAEAMAESTLAPLAAIVNLFLPPGLNQQADTVFELRDSALAQQKSNIELSSTASRLIKLLNTKGALRGRQIDHYFNQVDWRKTAQYLIKRGILDARPVLPPARVHPKLIRTAQLAVTPESAEAAMHSLGKKQTIERRQKALRFLMRVPEAVNVSWVYAESSCSLKDLQELEERELIVLRETEIWRDPLQRVKIGEIEKNKVLELTQAQQNALTGIEAGFQDLSAGKPIKPFLLDGVTGSGKTEVYIRAAKEALRRGKRAIILVPEIALTPQTIRRFLAHFPGVVGLIHSKLSAGERYDTWRRARAGSLKIVIGARSALFTPLPNLGLIVLDECHDGSYYQSEPPFYQAVSVGQIYARLAGALCLLGSATPSVVQRYLAETKEIIRLELPNRISRVMFPDETFGQVSAQSKLDLDHDISSGLPPVSIVDMREELKAGQRGIFSRMLVEGLETTLKRGEQAILFLNRRGSATYIFCRDCGLVVKCPRCNTPMTLHLEEKERLLCHHCGYERNMPDTCANCGSKSIRAYGLGSEKVEAEVQAIFPKVRTLRWDWETTRQKDAHEIILSHFSAQRADVLVGTQMLAKGLDLPLVTLVGIVLADVGLNLPDPFAAERVFQVLTQVAGRAGRSERGGQVIMQTFMPENYAIQAAAAHDVNGFYYHELEQRKRLGYPPFTRLIRLEYRHRDPDKAEKEARDLYSKIGNPVTDIGPVPCFYNKLNGEYRWQIVLRGHDPASIVKGKVPEDWRIEVEPISLL
jgi:primosomal protein N' (replication factor Y)